MFRVILSTFLLLASGCGLAAKSGLDRGCMSPEAEALAGLLAARDLEKAHGGVVADPDALCRMERIGQRLLDSVSGRPDQLKCRLLDTEAVNAFSLPGGLIYVSQGLYRRLDQDAVLAAVLAHELAHIVARDSFKPRCCSAEESLERELTADRAAVDYLTAAGYPPESLIQLLESIRSELPPRAARMRIAQVERLCGESRHAEPAFADGRPDSQRGGSSVALRPAAVQGENVQ